MKFKRHLRAPKSKAARGEAAHSVHEAIENMVEPGKEGII
jgi:hypothetical protein